ncbi:MAG: hypothetical protein JXX14_26645 [Deltaproteobacteria bacterium]|nr:hypothetical protein [Deltaproteobacteria bacterium]
MKSNGQIRLNGGSPYSIKAIRRAVFRFCVYGAILVFGEVAFYTITKVGREIPLLQVIFEYQWCVDDRLHLSAIWDTPISVLYGQASLWMFFVYAAICLFGIEPVYKKIHRRNIFLRGLTYMCIVLVMECITGWILFFITGYRIWYYSGTLSIFTFTSLAIAPMWFVVGLMSENFIHLVAKLNLTKDRLAAQASQAEKGSNSNLADNPE